VEKTVFVLLGIKERAEEVLHFMCGWTNRGEDHVFDRKTQRSCRKKKKTTLVDFEGPPFFFFLFLVPFFFFLRKEKRFWENSGVERTLSAEFEWRN
jgi:hypothetical protein